MENTTVVIQNDTNSTIITTDFVEWKTTMTNFTTVEGDFSETIVTVSHSVIASVGIIGNFTVIVVFLNHQKYRRKVPNIFILNQVSKSENHFELRCVFLTIQCRLRWGPNNAKDSNN